MRPYPDGTALLIVSLGASEAVVLSRLDLTTRTVQSLGELPQTSSRIFWATPGKSVYVSRNVDGITNLWEYSLLDHSFRQITFGPGPDRALMADPNGKGTYFINGKSTGVLTLYRPASRQSLDILNEDASQPTISNDGRRVAYIVATENNKSKIWLSDLDGSHRVKLAFSGSGLETLAWSNDDSKFLYADLDRHRGKLFMIHVDGTHLQEIPWTGEFVGWAVWEPGDRSLILSGLASNGTTEENWHLVLDGSPAAQLFDNCSMTFDVSPDRRFYLTTTLWGENPSISQYSVADKKCTVLKPGLATFLAMFSSDGKSFYYSVTSRGETTIFRQPWRNGSMVGRPVPALRLPFAMREDYGGNAFAVSRDLSSIIYVRPSGHDDLYLLSTR